MARDKEIYEKVPALRFVDTLRVREDRGLLPWPSPLKEFPEYMPGVFQEFNEVARELPKNLYQGFARHYLRQLPELPLEKLEGSMEDLAFRMLSFFVHTYAFSDCVINIDAKQQGMIPSNLARPFSALAKKRGVPPVLAYDAYAMNNFEIIDSKKPIRFNNLKLLQHFTVPPWDDDESGFILPHVEIEAEAGPGLVAIANAQRAVVEEDFNLFRDSVYAICSSLVMMEFTLSRMPDVCNPANYVRHVRPWIFYLENITFEGVGFYKFLKGETGAESSSIFSFDRAVRTKHKDSRLTYHIEELKKHRPTKQKKWLRAVERGPSIKKFAKKYQDKPGIRDAFNWANDGLFNFGKTHLRTAFLYIKAQGRGEKATGGTHYEEFLAQLNKERKENRI